MRRKKLEELVNAHNEIIDGYKKKIMEYSPFVDPIFVQHKVNLIGLYSVSMFDFDFGLCSKKEFTEKINSYREVADSLFPKIIVNLDDLKDKVECHKKEYINFMERFTGGFITLREICTNKITLMFVESTVQKDYEYELYGIDSIYNEATRRTISPLSYIVSYMTREEFDNSYFPKRIENSRISNEVELEKYGVELTQLFNQHYNNRVE